MNYLKHLISDEIFNKLSEKNLLNEKAIRDHNIYRMHIDNLETMRKQESIKLISELNESLQFETIKKILDQQKKIFSKIK